VFQNIQRENFKNSEFNTISRRTAVEIAKELFSIHNVVIYLIAFMVSMVGFSSQNLILSISPFAVSFLGAMLSNKKPIGIVYILTLIGTFISFGQNSLLTYFLTTLIFFVLVLFKRPKEIEFINEQKRIGIHLVFSVLIVQIVPLFFTHIYVYDILTNIMLAISSFVFYKIFSNSILMLQEFGTKKAYSIEEVIGTSLLLCIGLCALKDFNIWGYSIRNILSILIVLVLGWKNGMLIGATSGITIGVVLGIIGNSDVVTIASYAISGMIAGIFYKLGKIGVIIGFIVGNVILTYVANGNTVPVILMQEILIAALGLLALPKRFKIDINDFYGKDKLLPETTTRTISENEDTILKLNSISETISDLAKSYEEKTLDEQNILTNKQIFTDELEINIEKLENNILYEDILENNKGIVDEIFKHLLSNDLINEKQLVEIFEKHNLYIVGFKEKEPGPQNDVSKMIKAINSSYRISKVNFVWQKKIKEDRKNVSAQLEGVSEAIQHMAEEMKQERNDSFEIQKKEIMAILKQKDININNLKIKKNNSGRYFVEIYTNICEDIDGKTCDIKKISKVLEKVLQTKFTIQSQECGLRQEKEMCKFTYYSEDKYKMQIGVATSTKAGSPVSGDSHIEVKLEDGKYLLAISDGMGSGPNAMKSSKIAIKLLERLLKAGFDKEISLKLINSNLIANTTEEDMYTTLDIQVLDLFDGNMEFMKNGASPTFVKRKKDVQILKSITLPAGIIEKNDLIVYDYDLEDGDIVVMCSDGIIEANGEFINKELWVKYLLEDLSITDAQQIANMLLKEAIDSDYGMKKDDMTVIVAKIEKKK